MAKSSLIQISRILNVVAFCLITGAALAAAIYTSLSAAGVMPWFTLAGNLGETSVGNAGQILQIALTVLLICLAFFLPTSARVMALESSHRKFHLKMEDVARAYHHCHAADRAGVFSLSSEFDEVRERLAYLRDHPELGQLETDVLEIAAQMSQQSKHIAEIYADEKVARAKTFLRQRQEEVEKQQELIVQALHDCDDIKRWAAQVDAEQSVVASQLQQLDKKLHAALPELGYDLPRRANNIVPIKTMTAAE